MFWHLLVPLVQHQFHLYYLLFGYLLIKPIEGNTSLNNLEKFCKYGGLFLAIWGF